MVSDASKKKAAQKKAAAAAKRGAKAVAAAASKKAAAIGSENLTDGIGSLTVSDRTCTGVLCSHPLSRDIRLEISKPSRHQWWKVGEEDEIFMKLLVSGGEDEMHMML